MVLGCAVDDRVHLVANFAPAFHSRGRDPEKLLDALATARLEIERALS